MIRRGRLVAATVVLALVAILGPSAGAQDGPTPGFTDIRLDGSTIVITVNLTVIISISDDEVDPAGVAWGNAGFAAAERFWNDAFERLGDCPEVRLELNVRYSSLEHALDVEPLGHLVYPYSQWSAGTLPDGRGLPTVVYPGLPPETPGDADVPYPYDELSEAYYPEWLFEDPWAMAHELGHLFGLGDDYHDGEVIPGREGTLMGGTLGGDYVDRPILDDILSIAGQAGYDLPECETWTGTMRLAFDGNIASGAEFPCRGTVDLGFEIAVRPDGTFDGAGESSGAPFTCETDVGPVPGVNPSGPFTISGTKTDEAFDIHLLLPGAGSGCCAAWPGDRLGQAHVPLVAPDRAEADISSSNDIGQTWVGSLTLSVSMTCTSCAADAA